MMNAIIAMLSSRKAIAATVSIAAGLLSTRFHLDAATQANVVELIAVIGTAFILGTAHEDAGAKRVRVDVGPAPVTTPPAPLPPTLDVDNLDLTPDERDALAAYRRERDTPPLGSKR